MRHALRSLLRTPVFTATVLLALVLGMASTGSMFAIMYGVLLSPLPYGEPDRLISVELHTPATGAIRQPAELFHTYRQFARLVDEVAYTRTGSANLWSTDGSGDAESITATWMSASLAPMLRVPPLLGRSFTEEEELRGGPDAAILSERVWRERFGADPEVLGKTLVINNVTRQIVGVMPARFAFPTAETRVWLPAKHIEGETVGDFSYHGQARLAPDATLEQVQAELTATLPQFARRYPRYASGGATAAWLEEASARAVVRPLRDVFVGDIAGTLWILAATAALVLLVAWASVINLMLIRTDARQHEVAIRAALGADRWRVLSQPLGEMLVLGGLASLLAILATMGALQALVAFGPTDLPRLSELRVGWPTVGFIILVGAAGAIVCTMLPTLRTNRSVQRANLPTHLRDGSRAESASKHRQRLREGMTTLQIALALAASCGAALLLRTAYHLHDVHPGFDGEGVTTVRTLLPFARYREASAVDFHARLLERVRQLPSVQAAGLVSRLPLSRDGVVAQPFRVDQDDRSTNLSVNVADAGYFDAMRIPLLVGEPFQRVGLQRSTDLLISRRAAEVLFDDPGGAAAVGRRLTLETSGPSYTVIGVVGDVHDTDLASPPSPMVYRPQAVSMRPGIEPGALHSMALVWRANGPPDASMSAIRSIVRDLDPAVPLFNITSMPDVMRASTARLSFVLTLVTAAAAVTLLLGMIGLYGVMTYMVALRTREFGIRIALGADPGKMARLVAARALALAVAGIALGILMYAMASPMLQSLLYGVTATDPATLATASLVLACLATLTTWLPARRAAQVPPAEALRAE